jgi:hypothetical protein
MNRFITLIFLALTSTTAFSLPIRITQQEAEKWIVPRIPLDQDSSRGCRMTLMYPQSFEDVSCGSDAAGELGASMRIDYFRLLDQAPDTFKTISARVSQKNFQEFMNSGADGILLRSKEDDSILRDRQGNARAESVLGCNQFPFSKTTVLPIYGSNWNGWLWEHHFIPTNRKVSKECKELAQYRCFSLALGNDKMSMSVSGNCLARKRVANNDPAASFDVFMDMIKTIRFTEGSIIEPIPK